jgi:hypothetical protein
VIHRTTKRKSNDRVERSEAFVFQKAVSLFGLTKYEKIAGVLCF